MGEAGHGSTETESTKTVVDGSNTWLLSALGLRYASALSLLAALCYSDLALARATLRLVALRCELDVWCLGRDPSAAPPLVDESVASETSRRWGRCAHWTEAKVRRAR